MKKMQDIIIIFWILWLYYVNLRDLYQKMLRNGFGDTSDQIHIWEDFLMF
jgi:hypothetical protein